MHAGTIDLSRPQAPGSQWVAARGTRLERALIPRPSGASASVDSQRGPVPHQLERIPRWLSLADGDRYQPRPPSFAGAGLRPTERGGVRLDFGPGGGSGLLRLKPFGLAPPYARFARWRSRACRRSSSSSGLSVLASTGEAQEWSRRSPGFAVYFWPVALRRRLAPRVPMPATVPGAGSRLGYPFAMRHYGTPPPLRSPGVQRSACRRDPLSARGPGSLRASGPADAQPSEAGEHRRPTARWVLGTLQRGHERRCRL